MDRTVDVKVVFQHKSTDKTVSTEDGGSVQSHCQDHIKVGNIKLHSDSSSFF